MNKNLMIAAVVVVVLLLLGGFFVLNKNNKMGQSAKPAASSNSSISSIQDALTRNMSLECNYTTSSGTKVVAYVKNGMVRSDVSGATAQETGSTIIKDKKIYFWNSTSALVMAMPEVSATPSAGDKTASKESSLDALNQYRQYCKNATVADSLFVLPTGIKFQDTSEMMKMMPSGIKAPTGSSGTQMTEQQIQDAMKKYQTPSQ